MTENCLRKLELKLSIPSLIWARSDIHKLTDEIRRLSKYEKAWIMINQEIGMKCHLKLIANKCDIKEEK